MSNDATTAAMAALHLAREPEAKALIAAVLDFMAGCGVHVSTTPPALRAIIYERLERAMLKGVDIGARFEHLKPTIPGKAAPEGTYRAGWDDEPTEPHGSRAKQRQDRRK